MDDIIVHAAKKPEHDRILLEVLRSLKGNNLCLAPDKCEWAVNKVEFLGYISGEGAEMTDDRVGPIKKIKPVNSLKEVQIGFANFPSGARKLSDRGGTYSSCWYSHSLSRVTRLSQVVTSCPERTVIEKTSIEIVNE